MLFLFSQALNYFVLPYRTMFDASQDRYIPNLIYQIITLIKSIVGIHNFDSGDIIINGRSIKKESIECKKQLA